MKTKHFVRIAAGGCVMGSQMENSFGRPLTLREADKIAAFENERSAKRRAQGIFKDTFEYFVDSISVKRQLEISAYYAGLVGAA